MKHKDSTRKKLSEIRKKYLNENPDKHPWKKSDKFKSVPCEKFKNILKQHGLTFVEEYQPLSNKFFSIDISFPDKKIGIEINGNQHYDRNGQLKNYYKDRKKLIEKEGWKLFDYHYSVAYDETMCKKIISSLKNDYDLSNIDYSFFVKEKKEIAPCIDCGAKKKWKTSLRCPKCASVNNGLQKRKTTRPPHQELLKLISEKGYCAVGRMFGVSDNSIRKWLRTYTETNLTNKGEHL